MNCDNLQLATWMFSASSMNEPQGNFNRSLPSSNAIGRRKDFPVKIGIEPVWSDVGVKSSQKFPKVALKFNWKSNVF